jgi:hypothetical protein
MLHSNPDFEPMLITKGIEASWQLCNWESLDYFIRKVDSFEEIELNLLKEMYPDDNFQVLLYLYI